MFHNDLVDKTHCDYAKTYLMLYAIALNRVKFLEYSNKTRFSVVKQSLQPCYTRNKNLVFCVIGNEIS